MTAFEEQCREAAKEFLQTVVLVDDEAKFVGTNELQGEAGRLETPDEDEPHAAREDGERAVVAGRAAATMLDAGIVTERFADLGLVCAVLKPDRVHRLENQVAKAAERADIVILDWQMNDEGELAQRILSSILGNDDHHGHRMRLVAIYTSQSPLRGIAERIAGAFDSLAVEAKGGASGLHLKSRNGKTKVVLLSKGGGNTPEEAHLVTEPAELPERIVGEFATFVGGLLPNVAIAAIGEMRRNTHRMLARLTRDLDGPLISHRALVANVEDADTYVAALVHEEIEAQIPFERIAHRYTGNEALQKYLDHNHANGRPPLVECSAKPSENGQKVTLVMSEDPELAMLVIGNKFEELRLREEGLARKYGKYSVDLADHVGRSNGKRFKAFMGLGGDRGAESKDLHMRFSVISGTRRTLDDQVDDDLLPRLRLGTLLRDGEDYLLCITPICDSVRIGEGTRGNGFSFVRLTKSKTRFSIVVPDGGERTGLLLDRKNLQLLTIKFSATDGSVVARRDDADRNVVVFDVVDETVDNPADNRIASQGGNNTAPGTVDASPADALPTRSVRWIADLKPLQAQRVVGSIGAHLSRIGLDEFEWLRLQADGWS